MKYKLVPTIPKNNDWPGTCVYCAFNNSRKGCVREDYPDYKNVTCQNNSIEGRPSFYHFIRSLELNNNIRIL